MKIKTEMIKNKVFIYAILFSATWHIVWLSAFTVTVVPKAEKSVKFSNVSFLGPILEKGILNVNVNASDRTLLEKKYLSSINAQPALKRAYPLYNSGALPPLETFFYGNDEGVTAISAANIDRNKIEPGRMIR